MSSRGLPGFLRRTRRGDLDESDDDVDATVEGPGQLSSSSSSSIARNTGATSAVTALNPTRESDIAKGSTEETDLEQERTSSEPHRTGSSGTPNSSAGAANDMEASLADQDSIHSSSASQTNLTSSKPVSYRESQFNKILGAPVVKLPELRNLGWNGIPPEYRGMAWKLLLGYLPTNQSRRTTTLIRKRAEYKDAMAQHYDIDDNSRTLQEQETLRQVLVDVPRTAPEIPLFRNERIKRTLGRLLYIWAMRHPASSYVQGINDLATPLFAVFLSDYYNGEDVMDGNVMVVISEERLEEVEADVYWCLTNILAGIQDHYTADQPGVQRMVMRLEDLVHRIDASLCAHFESMGVQFMQFAFKWMNCLLLREFNLKCVIRLWDTYIAEDGFEDFHVYVCAAFLCQFSAQLQAMDFDELFGFMQQVPTEDWGETEIEMLLSQAYVLSTLFGGSEAHLNASNRRSGGSAL